MIIFIFIQRKRSGRFLPPFYPFYILSRDIITTNYINFSGISAVIIDNFCTVISILNTMESERTPINIYSPTSETKVNVVWIDLLIIGKNNCSSATCYPNLIKGLLLSIKQLLIKYYSSITYTNIT